MGTAAFYKATPPALTAAHGPLRTGVPLADRRAEPAGRRAAQLGNRQQDLPWKQLHVTEDKHQRVYALAYNWTFRDSPGFLITVSKAQACRLSSETPPGVAPLTSRSCSSRRRVRLRTMWRLRMKRPTLRASSSASSRPPTMPVAMDGILGLEQGGHTRGLVCHVGISYIPHVCGCHGIV